VSLSVLGFWLERNALVWPCARADRRSHGLPIEIGITLSFLGAFIAELPLFTRVFPTLPLPKRS
jgi:hypothetical protein